MQDHFPLQQSESSKRPEAACMHHLFTIILQHFHWNQPFYTFYELNGSRQLERIKVSELWLAWFDCLIVFRSVVLYVSKAKPIRISSDLWSISFALFYFVIVNILGPKKKKGDGEQSHFNIIIMRIHKFLCDFFFAVVLCYDMRIEIV
jgi:hypothetical protein